MDKTKSLQKNTEFQAVFSNGRSYANKYFIMYVSKNQTQFNRLGISVSKKVGNSVVRHRIKRLVKENYRLREKIFNSGLDIVVIARKGSDKVDFNSVGDALIHLLKLHHVIIIPDSKCE